MTHSEELFLVALAAQPDRRTLRPLRTSIPKPGTLKDRERRAERAYASSTIIESTAHLLQCK